MWTLLGGTSMFNIIYHCQWCLCWSCGIDGSAWVQSPVCVCVCVRSSYIQVIWIGSYSPKPLMIVCQWRDFPPQNPHIGTGVRTCRNTVTHSPPCECKTTPRKISQPCPQGPECLPLILLCHALCLCSWQQALCCTCALRFSQHLVHVATVTTSSWPTEQRWRSGLFKLVACRSFSCRQHALVTMPVWCWFPWKQGGSAALTESQLLYSTSSPSHHTVQSYPSHSVHFFSVRHDRPIPRTWYVNGVLRRSVCDWKKVLR